MSKKIAKPALTKILLGAVVVLSAAYLSVTGYKTYSLKKSIGQKENDLMAYKREGLPGLERKKRDLEKRLRAIENSYNEIVEKLSSGAKARMPKEAGDALKFKEELFKVQTKLKERGSAIGFQFPAGLGFAKYEKEIPTGSDLLIRVKQLDIIAEIGDIMLSSKVPQITAIEFKDVKDVTVEGDKEAVYKEFPLKISFKCQNENLMNFLYGLSVSDIPFSINSLNLKAADVRSKAKGELTVEFTIVAAIFP